MRKPVLMGGGFIAALAALLLAGCVPVTPAPTAGQAGAPTAGAPATVIIAPTALISATPAAATPVVTGAATVTGTVDMTPTIEAAAQPAVAAAQTYLAAQLGAAPTAVSVVSVEAVEWPDACLGAAEAGQMCAQVITPGYRVTLNAADAAGQPQQYEVRTDAAGRAVRLFRPAAGGAATRSGTADDATAALVWERSGGLAGVCQKLTVQPNGAYTLEDCKRNTVTGQGKLPAEDAAKLAAALKQYGAVQWQPTPPARGADMFQDRLTLRGRGGATLSAADASALSEYLGGLATRLAKTAVQ